MARKSTTTSQTTAPALLAKPRDEVRAQLLSRQQIGEALRDRPINNGTDLETARAEYQRWDDFNHELLRRAFTTEEYATRYRSSGGVVVIGMTEKSWHQKAQDFRERVASKIDRLASLLERLDIIDEEPGVRASKPNKVQALSDPRGPVPNNKIFLVHGRDEEAKAVVARFIERCGLEAIILHEQPNGGRTIIEKFEKEADVHFAVVLLTPDDVGGVRDGTGLTSANLQARARQNVVLELGYFSGRLGRGRVAALKKGDLELPTDIAGVVWTALGNDEAWKMSLARELRAAGYEFDVAKALGI